MFLFFIVFLSILSFVQILIDAARVRFSFSPAEWIPRLLPSLCVVALSCGFYRLLSQDGVAICAALMAMLDIMLVMRPASGDFPWMYSAYVLVVSSSVGAVLLLSAAGHLPSEAAMAAVSLLPPLSALLVLVVEMCRKHSAPNLLMHNVAVWAGIEYSSQLFYVFVLSFALLVLSFSDVLSAYAVPTVAVILLTAMSVFFYWRSSLGVPYLMRRKSARKASQKKEVPPHVTPEKKKSPEERMAEHFRMAEEYMKRSQPYLDYTFTLTDLSDKLYVNKTSLSKAINKHSGLNFCQYVNKYRVDYAVSLMEKDPSRLKVAELAIASGFNSIVSFNMAFRLFKEDTPSEYMRTLHARNLERGRRD